MTKLLFALVLLFKVTPLFADPKECEENSIQVDNYLGAIKLNRSNSYKGFLAFCSLAYRGDHRAQFRVAEYYHNGIASKVEKNNREAYRWAAISNSFYRETRKSEFVTMLSKQWSEHELSDLVDQSYALFNEIGVIGRIDKAVSNNSKNSLEAELGSHIKRKSKDKN